MAYPTGTLSVTLDAIDRRMIHLKEFSQRRHDTMAAGSVPSAAIFDVFINLRIERSGLIAAAATPGIGQYARDQKNDQGLDVVVEFNAVIAAIDSVTSWITANFPTSGGFLLERTLEADGPVDRSWAPAQTAGLRTALLALIATIN